MSAGPRQARRLGDSQASFAPHTIGRVSPVVSNRQNANAIFEDSIADGIWEALQMCFPTSKWSQGKRLRIRRDQHQSPLNFLEKLIAQPVFAIVIPGTSGIDLPLHGFVIRKLHA